MLTIPPVPFDFCVAFNQEKAIVGAFSVIVQLVVEPMEHYTALLLTLFVVTNTSGSVGEGRV